MVVLGGDPALRGRIERALTQPVSAGIVALDPSAVAALRAAHPAAAIVVVGVSRGAVGATLDAGADAAMPGVPDGAELRARLRAVARRRRPVLAVGALELRPADRAARLDGRPLSLAPREFDVLCCLAGAAGGVVTKASLMARCWEAPGPDPAGRALERCVSRLRARLGAHAPLLVTVWGVGYRLGEPG